MEMLDPSWMPGALLGLKLWFGSFEEHQAQWIRWCDEGGNFLPFSIEKAESALAEADTARAEAETARTEAETARTEAALAQQRIKELEARLRDSGLGT